MSKVERLNVTLPLELVRAIDEIGGNRSGFLAEAARRELRRRKKLMLRECLDDAADRAGNELLGLAEAGLADAVAALPDEDVSEMVAPSAGVPVRWTPGPGWEEA